MWECDWFFFPLGFCDWFSRKPIPILPPKFDWFFVFFNGFHFSNTMFKFTVARLLDGDLMAVMKSAEDIDWQRIPFILEAWFSNRFNCWTLTLSVSISAWTPSRSVDSISSNTSSKTKTRLETPTANLLKRLFKRIKRISRVISQSSKQARSWFLVGFISLFLFVLFGSDLVFFSST